MAKLAALLLILTISSVAKPSESTSNSNSNSIEFVRSSCSSTLYPSLCFSSLSPYASTINHDPLKLSQLAILLAHSRIQSVSTRVSSLSISTAPSSTTNSAYQRVTIAKALKDCTQVLGSAVDRAKDSMAELKKLNKKNSGTESRWCLSNVQTWMSAALTNEETCTDGLKEATGAVAAKGSVVVDVGARVGVAKEYTSNALALVNKLSSGTSV